ncbi:MAG: hypothetical protein SFV55_01970 [Haliscomenobacter sp.]|uniref:hypothetical protein n=1 Tax=Haliscomenobacter sp. TaxID=2717303 RepID=UPI0029B98C5B|nr:hypothetical protein [Haliscomenobacter sp.]MDX2067158.1 hypothetical protein [Haliscomenobacter sp.]
MISKNEFSEPLAKRLEASEAGNLYPAWEEERMWEKVTEKMNPPRGLVWPLVGLMVVLALLITGLSSDQTSTENTKDSSPEKRQLDRQPIADARGRVHFIAIEPVLKHRQEKQLSKQKSTPIKCIEEPLAINAFEQDLPAISIPDSNTIIFAFLWDQGIYTDATQDGASIDVQWVKEQSFDLLRPTMDSTNFPHHVIKLKTTN